MANFDNLPRITLDRALRLSRLDQLLRSAEKSRQSNPRNAGLASGVTVTAEGTTNPAGLTKAYLYPSNTDKFAVSGGQFAEVTSGLYRLRAAVIAETGGNLAMNDGSQGTYGRVRIMTDASKMSWRVGPTSAAYRFLVDGQYVSASGTTTVNSGGATHEYISLDFGSSAVREVTLEMQLACALVGAYVGPTESIWAPEDDRLNLVLLGDSMVYGTNTSLKGDAYGAVLADWLGVNGQNSGSGGTGWATPTNYRFDERIDNGDLELGGSPDIIVLTASYNDRALSQATVTANALSGMLSARSQYPSVPIFVMGCLPGATGPSSQIVATEAAVKSAFDSFGDPFSAFVPISESTTAGWITGTGAVGSTTGTGNSDRYTDADTVHPNEDGHDYIGRQAAAAAVDAARVLRDQLLAA